MIAEAELQEYLDEIRQKVCSCCVERPPGGPPCTRLGKVCGVELHLEHLVEAIHEVHSPLIEPYLTNTREKVCAHCAFLHQDCCPCPMDTLTVLITDAIEAVDERRGRKEKGRKWLAGLPNQGAAALEEIDRAYEEGAGAWTGCDWPTTFGRGRVDLNGMRADEAEGRAVELIWREEIEAWEQAARWLRNIELQADEAERQAGLAVSAAHAGRWRDAADYAHRAWALEVHTGRPLRHDAPAWRRLYHAVVTASRFAAVQKAEPAHSPVPGAGRP